jgi:hypothetical protein
MQVHTTHGHSLLQALHMQQQELEHTAGVEACCLPHARLHVRPDSNTAARQIQARGKRNIWAGSCTACPAAHLLREELHVAEVPLLAVGEVLQSHLPEVPARPEQSLDGLLGGFCRGEEAQKGHVSSSPGGAWLRIAFGGIAPDKLQLE